MRTRLRGGRAPLTIALFLVALGAVSALFLTIASSESEGLSPRLGLILFTVLSIIELGLITLSVPAQTSGAISGERERQTLDLLLVTQLTPWRIVMGKLYASLSYTLLLVVASLPIFSLLFFFGGVSTAQLVQVLLIWLATAFLLGSIGIWLSTLIRRTTVATMLGYGFALFFYFGTIVLSIFVADWAMRPYWEALRQGLNPPQPQFPVAILWLARLNPGVALASVIAGPVLPAAFELFLYRNFGGPQSLEPTDFWPYSIVLFVIIGLLFCLWAAHLTRPVRARGRRVKASA